MRECKRRKRRCQVDWQDLCHRWVPCLRGSDAWRGAWRGSRSHGTDRLCSASLFLSLRYVSTSLLWGQGVAGTTVATSSSAWRSHWQCTGRHMEGLRHGHHTAMRCTRSPWRLCGSVTGGVHSCPQGGHRSRTTPPAGQPAGCTREETSPQAPQCLVRRYPPGHPLFASLRWPRHM